MRSRQTRRSGVAVPLALAGPAVALALFGACAAPDGPAARGPVVIEPQPDSTAPGVLGDGPRIVSRTPWRFGRVDGEEILTPHYVLRSTAGDARTRERAARFLEHALRHYRTALGPLPAPTLKLDTYLMDTRSEWERLTLLRMGDDAETLLTIQRGGYASRGVGVYYDLGLRDTLSIAAHEGWHQYIQRVFGAPLPAWLDEAVATYMEGHRWSHETPVFLPWANSGRFDALRQAHAEGALVPLDRLFTSRPQDFLTPTNRDVVAYYAQVWALAHFLNEGADGRYQAALRAVLRDAAAGDLRAVLAERLGERAASGAIARRTGPEVALAYFNDDLDLMAREYAAFIERIVATGSREAVIGGRSPIAAAAASPFSDEPEIPPGGDL